ncbi:hypothetical protein GO755_25545 [Spirosoma sp. HMF4905]|uniref:Uncharacterized protein n=1 Tax=Spirosoma arboris TaxID=2682092 RepID=A0A7K1SHX8_9BACT|nr:hypothetical protein [Spirosoma arboris]MVM33427.1 hypothetical protein [Spirosoma arboris]
MAHFPSSLQAKYSLESSDLYNKLDTVWLKELEQKEQEAQKNKPVDKSLSIIEELILSKKLREEKLCKAMLADMGIKKYRKFTLPTNEILEAIRNKKEIDGFNIANAVKNPKFRFYTSDSPLASLEISNTMASVIKDIKDSNIFMKRGRQKRQENADEYARNIHSIINEVTVHETFKSFREAANFLNDQKIPTPLNKRWQPRTLTLLNQRWEALGLSTLTPKPK